LITAGTHTGDGKTAVQIISTDAYHDWVTSRYQNCLCPSCLRIGQHR